ncbi:unnamed protein product [Rotaria socialis]|uniref:FACT complex subunit n=2 Tax=Rotaria socialis TaxID=392032 RepID=A0A819V2B8_9BILA|nr:unnamed protein product [Rotaria socialis]CAF3186682.1 unnamed protein product [Rotaria socialis]CAF3302047.1 unnamed protein product [Rotaria socialis]CAF3677445.1 unnamed protein product [Rotaria socialis]CAF4099905.1 unnamed protein product [Rotaria socialis]
MPSDVIIDGARCLERIRRLYAAWRNNDGADISTNDNGALHSVDAVVLIRGQKEEDFTYSKSAAMQTWLFGYEMHDVLVVFCHDSVIVFAGAKKINYLKQIETEHNNKENAPRNFNFIIRKENDEKNLDEIIKQIKMSHQGKTLGIFAKDKMEGPFWEQWQNCLTRNSFETVDISSSIGYLIAVKDNEELGLIRKACEITGKLYSKHLKDQIINIVDSERKVKHSKLSEGLESALNDEKYVSSSDANYVEMCYPAIIQSGGNYNLKFSATVDKNSLHFGGSSIICAFGIRYKSYCSNVVRTLLVNPSEEMKNSYQFLLDCEEVILRALKHDVPLCDVYKLVREKVTKERPELLSKMTTNLGTALGIEFRESTIAITSKCTTQAKKGMTFQVSIGFSGLENPDGKDEQSKVYSLFIGDTIVVNEHESCTIYTSSKKDISHIAIILKDDDTPEDDADNRPAIVPRRAAAEKARTDPSVPEESRQEYQKGLLRRLNERAEIRLTSQGDKVSAEKARKINNSYKSEGQLPQDPDIQDLKLYMDKRYETLVLPINGASTPFHISTIKNVSLAVEGEYIYLRINFFHPGGIGKQADAIDKENVYIKELTYRASNDKKDDVVPASNNLSHIHKLILEIQKKYKDQEQERKQMEGVVKQDALVLNASKTNPKLKDLYIRPSLANKKINGTLEAHTNGFRYTSVRGDKIDILYSNVSHAFYQPCDNEMIILLHFHLKHAIVFGKRKQMDVQFYTEVGELTTDLGKHRNMHDKDDVLAEQAERDLRSKLKGAFQSFIDKVLQQKSFPFEFETPFRPLGFHGTPHRSMVLILPTTSCVVQLTEWPPLVIVLEEVELVHFERVHFQLKNFDMVFIMKDYSRKTQSIQAIPMAELDPIKNWLNSCDICYTDGPQSLNWAKIMKTITDDLSGFFSQGGWTFLDAESDAEGEGGGGGEGSELEEDDYDPDEDESEEEGSDSDYSGEEDEDEVEEEDSVSEASENLGTDEESGKSWSELEEEARRDDAEKLDYDSDEASRNKKKGGASSKKSPVKSRKRPASSPPPMNGKKKKR